MNIPDLKYREFDPPCEDVVVQKIALYQYKAMVEAILAADRAEIERLHKTIIKLSEHIKEQKK